MRKFAVKILLFLSLPLVFILAMDTYLRNENSLYKEKYEGAIDQGDSIEILIVGNSHAKYGVDPQGFDHYAYNIANVSQSIYFDKRITSSILPHLPNLRYVIISVGYHSLYVSSQNNRDIWSYYGNGIKYKDTDYLLPELSPTLFGFHPKISFSLLKKDIVNQIVYDGEVLDFDVERGVNLQDTLQKGFISFEGSNPSSFTLNRYRNRVEEFNERIDKSDEKEEIVNDLEHFIEMLIAQEITPVIITPPTYSEFNKLLDPLILHDNKAQITELCNKYKIHYFDYMDSPHFKKEDFWNSDHLNEQGALKFARLLNDSIQHLENKRTLLGRNF